MPPVTRGMKSNKGTQRGLGILLLVAMVLGMLIGLITAQSAARRTHQSAHLQSKMEEVLQLVQRHYVDHVDLDSLSETLLSAMLSDLDPHSAYLPPVATERSQESLRGNFEGVGQVLMMEQDTVLVSQVMPDGPSAGCDIKAGDAVLTIDGLQVSGVGMRLDTVVQHMRGPHGSTAHLTVQSWGEAPREVSIRRGTVVTPSVPYYGMLDDTTGYIRLTTFIQTSWHEFRSALTDLMGQGMRHLVFDLRGNSGGLLADAIDIASSLLPRGSLIVYTEGAHDGRHNYRSRREGLFTEGRVTVLVDENSASASEVVSGALQDHDRATIAGRRTFGKGLVQTQERLSDGSMVLLTTARYYTPSGRCIQRPYDDGTEEYYRAYMQRLMDETYADSAFASVVDSTPYYTASGRTVYGGGGIIPDQILTYKKDESFVYYNALQQCLALTRTATDYVRRHHDEILSRYPDGEAFYRHFAVSEALVEAVVRRGEKEGVHRDAASLNIQRPLIKNTLKAYIGEHLYGTQMRLRVQLLIDEDLKRILNHEDPDNH